jgi:pimeloyl-ACP methyl ester carboxylesterase
LNGFNCISFAARGQKGSEGTYTFKNEEEDIHAIVDYLKGQDANFRIGLFGRSAGAIASLMFAVKHSDNISCIALWGTPTHVYEKHYRDPVPRNKMFASLRNEGVNIDDESFLRDIVNPEDIISKVKVPIFIGWGTNDTKYSSSAEQLEMFERATAHSCQIVFIKDAVHVLDSSSSIFKAYVSIYLNWFKMTLADNII